MSQGRAALVAPRPDLSAGSDLVLRPLDLGDVDALCRYAEDPELLRWTGVPTPFGSADAAAFVQRCQQGWQDGSVASFAISRAGRLVGEVELRLGEDGQIADVGFGLAAVARGARVMSRALRLVAGYGFDELGLELVHWRAAVGNWSSRRVAWACGFTHEGTLRGGMTLRGERCDAWAASLHRDQPMRPSRPWYDPPALTDGVVALRAWEPADATRVEQACTDPLTRRWLASLPDPYTPAHAAGYIASRAEEMALGHAVYWCVTEAARSPCQAAMSLMMRGDGAAELGWWAHPQGRGRGLVTRAARLAARHGFDTLGLQRILVRTAEGNAASAAVARRVGFRPAGRDRRAELLADPVGGAAGASWVDDLRFDLVAGELPGR